MPLGSVANDRFQHLRLGAGRVSTADGSPSLDLPHDATLYL